MFPQHLKRAGLNAAEVRAFTTAKELAKYPSENPGHESMRTTNHAAAPKTGADLVLFDPNTGEFDFRPENGREFDGMLFRQKMIETGYRTRPAAVTFTLTRFT